MSAPAGARGSVTPGLLALTADAGARWVADVTASAAVVRVVILRRAVVAADVVGPIVGTLERAGADAIRAGQAETTDVTAGTTVAWVHARIHARVAAVEPSARAGGLAKGIHANLARGANSAASSAVLGIDGRVRAAAAAIRLVRAASGGADAFRAKLSRLALNTSRAAMGGVVPVGLAPAGATDAQRRLTAAYRATCATVVGIP
jgi:hypothetical protein